MAGFDTSDSLFALDGPVRDWFAASLPRRARPRRSGWPGRRSPRGENLLLVSPTGTGKTLAAFLAILDGLYREHAAGTLAPGLRCVYVSPLRSLGYDIERNLSVPLEAIRAPARAGEEPDHGRGPDRATPRPTTAGSSASSPPHLLITTPESLALMLSQADLARRSGEGSAT